MKVSISAYAIPGIRDVDKQDMKTMDYRVNRIIEKVCNYYQVEMWRLKTKTRKRELVVARQFCIYFIRRNLHLSLKQTADVFNRDHTTAMHSIALIQGQIHLDNHNEMKSDYEHLIQIV